MVRVGGGIEGIEGQAWGPAGTLELCAWTTASEWGCGSCQWSKMRALDEKSGQGGQHHGSSWGWTAWIVCCCYGPSCVGTLQLLRGSFIL